MNQPYIIWKIGFPLITVTETPDGIHVRQDRFLENGDALAEENETIWFVYVDVVLQREFIPNDRKIPLGILTVDEEGKPHVDKTAILDEKEKTIAIDTTRNYKVNAGSIGFCAFFCAIACLFS
jgi:aminopeptidase 2